MCAISSKIASEWRARERHARDSGPGWWQNFYSAPHFIARPTHAHLDAIAAAISQRQVQMDWLLDRARAIGRPAAGLGRIKPGVACLGLVEEEPCTALELPGLRKPSREKATTPLGDHGNGSILVQDMTLRNPLQKVITHRFLGIPRLTGPPY